MELPERAMKPVKPRGLRRQETEARAVAPQRRMVQATSQLLPRNTKGARVLVLEALAEDVTNLNQEEITTMMLMMTTQVEMQETEIIGITTQQKSLKKRS